MNHYAKAENLLKNGQTTTGDDLREGLTAVVSVKLANPHFEGQTKVRLTNPEVAGFVETTVNEQLGDFLEEHPADAKRILNKAIRLLRPEWRPRTSATGGRPRAGSSRTAPSGPARCRKMPPVF